MDYYLRTGDAAETTRKQYVAHIASVHPHGRTIRQSLCRCRENHDHRDRTRQGLVGHHVAARSEQSITFKQSINSALAPAIDWPRLLCTDGHSFHGESLNVANPDFFKGLQPLIEDHRSRPPSRPICVGS